MRNFETRLTFQGVGSQLFSSSAWWRWIFNFQERHLTLFISLLLFSAPLPAVATPSFKEVTQTLFASRANRLFKQPMKRVRAHQFKAALHFSKSGIKTSRNFDECQEGWQSFVNRQSLVQGFESLTDTFEARQIPSGAMLPTLQINDRVLVCKIAYVSSLPQRGELVVFQATPSQQQQNLQGKFIFRVIGLPGETIEVKNKKVYINEQPLKEDYLEEAPDYTYSPTVVPANSYFVLGDNRNNSYDSQYWGFVPQSLITGKVLAILSPIQHQRVFDDSLKSQTRFMEFLSEVAALLDIPQSNTAELTAIFQDLSTRTSSLSNQELIQRWQQILEFYQRNQNRIGEAYALQNIGQVYFNSEETEQALTYFNQAWQIFQSLGNRNREAILLNTIGGIYLESAGKEAQALHAYNQALSISRLVGNRNVEAESLIGLGLISLKGKDEQQGIRYLNEAGQIARSVGDRAKEAIVLFYLSLLQVNQGNLELAATQMEEALTIIESFRTKISSEKLRTSYFSEFSDFYDLYVDILMQLDASNPDLGYAAKALAASERSRARTLLELLGEATADIRSGVDPELSAQERMLQQQIGDLEERRLQILGSEPTSAQASAIEKELTTLFQQYQEVQRKIRVNSPRYATLTQPQPLSLAEIQQQVLDEDTLLLEYALGEERSYLWVVTKTGLTSYKLPKRADIEALAQQFRAVLTDPVLSQDAAEVAKTAAQLSQVILAPVAPQLGKKRLLVVGDGVLQYIPFAALSLPVSPSNATASTAYEPLIVKHEIVYLPSASTLAFSRRELTGRTPAPKTIAMLADPVFSADDERLKAGLVQSNAATEEPLSTPLLVQRAARETGINLKRLPFTRQEAEAIMKLIPSTEREQSFDFDASRSAATHSQLNQYRILHFATHGILNPTHPELSGLVMSLVDRQGNAQNGFVRLNDIFNLNLSAELVVLSACKTGGGQNIQGEGIVGLTRGFMYAGAARVLASLWSVNDPATAELMTRFYQPYLQAGLPAAAALRAAQVEMFKQEKWQAPYYWAAFTLQGEWR